MIQTIEEFLKVGKQVEYDFFSLLGNKGHQMSFSCINDDMKKHWDLSYDGIKVDVKGLKKINRYDSEPNENFHFVELTNVVGEPGWLYGDADEFCFETEEYFILVLKSRLQNMIEQKTVKEFCKAPTLYKYYQRTDKKDVIVLVKTVDLILVAKKVYIKTK